MSSGNNSSQMRTCLMMRNKIGKSIIAAFFLSFIGCHPKRYKYTAGICDTKLYAEGFEINSAGVDAEYLTDSLNFRLYIGSIDSEHERYIYRCVVDSIYVTRMLSDDTSGKYHVASMRAYDLKEIRKRKIFETRYNFRPSDATPLP